MSLFDYQARFVADVQDAYRTAMPDGSRCTTVCGVMPCGAGKSASAIEGFIAPSVSRGHRVIFFADLGEILDDAAQRIAEAGCKVSVFRAGYRFDPSAEVCVASLQTCAKRLDELPEASRVIVDECHGSEAPTVKAVLARYPQALLLGLTATPARGDGLSLAEFQRLVCGPSMRELVGINRLVPATVFAPATVLDRGVARDPVEVMLERAHRRFAVFAPDAAQADRIAREASEAGHQTVAVLDGMGRDERRGVRARLESGEVRSLATVRALQKGFDAPVLDAVILTQLCSIVGYIQGIGRGQRAYPGKTDCEVHDLRGAVYLHGLPEDDRAWSLEGAQGKSTVDRPQGLRTCRACHAVTPPVTRCPRCGSTMLSDPRPMRVQRAEMFNASTVPVGERAAKYVAAVEKKLLERRMPAHIAARVARERAPSWVREALDAVS